MRPIAKECLKAWTSSSALEAKHHGNINPYHDMIFLPPLFGKLVLQAAKRQNVACGTAALLLSKLHFKERCLSLISSNRNSLSEILIWHYKELWDSRSRLRASKVPAPASEIARAFVLADFPLPFTFKILLVSILVKHFLRVFLCNGSCINISFFAIHKLHLGLLTPRRIANNSRATSQVRGLSTSMTHKERPTLPLRTPAIDLGWMPESKLRDQWIGPATDWNWFDSKMTNMKDTKWE